MSTMTAANGSGPSERAEHETAGFKGHTEEALKKMGTTRNGAATTNAIKGLDEVVAWVRDKVPDLAALRLTGKAKDRLDAMISWILVNQEAAAEAQGASEEHTQHLNIGPFRR